MNKGIRNIGTLLIFTQLLCTSAKAEEIIGKVVGVADGDTLTILVGGQDRIKIRLAEIDAPEKAQPYGQRSKQSLSDLCFDQSAVLQKIGIDRYGRTVAKVYCAGIYANAEQIRLGLAWTYRKYLHDQALLELENDARVSKRGLWVDSTSEPPWEYRAAKHRRKAR